MTKEQEENNKLYQDVYKSGMKAVVTTVTRALVIAVGSLFLISVTFYIDTTRDLGTLKEARQIDTQKIQEIDERLRNVPTIEQYHRDMDEIKMLLRRMEDKLFD